jgi:hypothetical protein
MMATLRISCVEATLRVGTPFGARRHRRRAPRDGVLGCSTAWWKPVTRRSDRSICRCMFGHAYGEKTSDGWRCEDGIENANGAWRVERERLQGTAVLRVREISDS